MIADRQNNQAGFTLAETMVALFILALISAAGSGLLLGATSTSKQIRTVEEDTRQIDIAQAIIRNDIAAMSPRAVRPIDGFGPPMALFGQDPRDGEVFLTFMRGGWFNPNLQQMRSDLQSVGYVFEDGALVRRATLRPDALRSTPVSERVLLNGIRRVDVRFMSDGQWTSRWNDGFLQRAEQMPELIELEIEFEDETSLIIATLVGARS